MASDASTDQGSWRQYSNQFQQKPSNRYFQRIEQKRDPQIHFQLSHPNHSHQPPQRFTIPLQLAMDASPVIETDFDAADLHNKNVVAVLDNEFNPNSVCLLLQYISRRHRALAARFPIDERFPKLWLWAQTYLLARQFEIEKLQILLEKRIHRRLLEFEHAGVMQKEWWGVIELVKDEGGDGEWEWLRRIVVDVKSIVNKAQRIEGISLENQLPEEGVCWEVFEALYDSQSSVEGDSKEDSDI